MTYTSQRCAEFLEYFPNAGGCEQAAALHHWGEVVEYRVAVGVGRGVRPRRVSAVAPPAG
jgi:hypothetical protein